MCCVHRRRLPLPPATCGLTFHPSRVEHSPAPGAEEGQRLRRRCLANRTRVEDARVDAGHIGRHPYHPDIGRSGSRRHDFNP